MTSGTALTEIFCSSPNCNNRLFGKCSDDNWRFRVKALRIENDGESVVAICKSCGAEVKLPMLLVPRDNQVKPLEKSFYGFGVVTEKKS